MSKVVYHLGGWGNNFGDRVLQVATSQIVQEACDEELHFVYVDNQKTYWSPCLIDKMNKEADLLLVGGGGFIFHRPEDSSRSGWQFNIRTEDVDKIKIPMAAYGLGYNKFPHDHQEFPQSMWDNLQAVIDKCTVFSVRNNGTFDTIRDHGINVDGVTVVPDPGMFISATPYSHPCLETSRLKIGVNWATDRPDQRFVSHEEASRKMRQFFNSLLELAQEKDAQIFLIDHLLREPRNEQIKDELHAVAKEILGDRVTILYEELFEDLFPPFDYLAGFFADIYRQMDMIIGMRGHSNIIAFGQNTPCIGLGQHNKVKWFLEHTGLDHLVVSLSGTAKDVRERLFKSVNYVHENLDTVRQDMAIRHDMQKYIKDDFVSKIAKAIGNE